MIKQCYNLQQQFEKELDSIQGELRRTEAYLSD